MNDIRKTWWKGEKIGENKPQNITEKDKKRYAWDVKNMLKQVCNVEVVIDGITTNMKE